MKCIDCEHLWPNDGKWHGMYHCAAKNDRDCHEIERDAYCSWFKRKRK